MSCSIEPCTRPAIVRLKGKSYCGGCAQARDEARGGRDA